MKLIMERLTNLVDLFSFLYYNSIEERISICITN